MNTLSYFADIEKAPARCDVNEGQAFWLQGEKVAFEVEVDGKFRSIAGIRHLAYRHPDDLRVNVFCMYALRASQAETLVDSRNFQFGDTFVVLRDGDAFLTRVQVTAEKTGFELKWDLVQYVDRQTFHGKMGIFRKASDFSYQSEFRIALLPGAGSPYVLDVGDLTDIAIIAPLCEINRIMRVR